MSQPGLSEPGLSDPRPAEPRPDGERNGARLLAHIAVVAGVVAVAAAAFVLSYGPVRQIALSAGVSVTLARLYPAIFDAVLVVACAAALTLREARWWTRLYAWLAVIVIVAVIGAADASHAMGVRLPHRIAAGTVAALPWALVMLGFSLWLSMLRHARTGRAAARAVRPPDPVTPSGLAASGRAGEIAIPWASEPHAGVRAVAPPLPARALAAAEPETPRPAPAESHTAPAKPVAAPAAPTEPHTAPAPEPGTAAAEPSEPQASTEAAPAATRTAEKAEQKAPEVTERPARFERVRSTPTPPGN
jgi:hypothetical protein